jgi:hypothetical protein
MMSEKNALVPLGISPGSKPLKHSKWERYARYRAQALPRIVAFRKLGNYAANDKIAHNNASRLENKPGVKDRIAYLTKQAEERIAEKRVRLEEALWNIHEADVGDLFETYEDGQCGGRLLYGKSPGKIGLATPVKSACSERLNVCVKTGVFPNDLCYAQAVN